MLVGEHKVRFYYQHYREDRAVLCYETTTCTNSGGEPASSNQVTSSCTMSIFSVYRPGVTGTRSRIRRLAVAPGAISLGKPVWISMVGSQLYLFPCASYQW